MQGHWAPVVGTTITAARSTEKMKNRVGNHGASAIFKISQARRTKLDRRLLGRQSRNFSQHKTRLRRSRGVWKQHRRRVLYPTGKGPRTKHEMKKMREKIGAGKLMKEG